MTEPAPVVGGETFTYRFEATTGLSQATIKLEADGKGGFNVTADPLGGFAAQHVDADLADGRNQIKLYYLGKLWLEPSARHVGAKTLVGNVTEQAMKNGWPVFVVADKNGAAGKRYYHTTTGFLVTLEIPVGGGAYRGALIGSSMAELAPN
ncbi:MAG: hypothetical protein KC933_19430 [Myxococcales bacterium]|nr:hypothetical protein [Myxococcales bacterium]